MPSNKGMKTDGNGGEYRLTNLSADALLAALMAERTSADEYVRRTQSLRWAVTGGLLFAVLSVAGSAVKSDADPTWKPIAWACCVAISFLVAGFTVYFEIVTAVIVNRFRMAGKMINALLGRPIILDSMQATRFDDPKMLPFATAQAIALQCVIGSLFLGATLTAFAHFGLRRSLGASLVLAIAVSAVTVTIAWWIYHSHFVKVLSTSEAEFSRLCAKLTTAPEEDEDAGAVGESRGHSK